MRLLRGALYGERWALKRERRQRPGAHVTVFRATASDAIPGATRGSVNVTFGDDGATRKAGARDIADTGGKTGTKYVRPPHVTAAVAITFCVNGRARGSAKERSRRYSPGAS